MTRVAFYAALAFAACSDAFRAPRRHAAAHRRRLRKCLVSHMAPTSSGIAVGRKRGTYTAIENSGGKYISAVNSGW